MILQKKNKAAVPKGLFVYLITPDKLQFFYFFLVCIYWRKYFRIKDFFFYYQRH